MNEKAAPIKVNATINAWISGDWEMDRLLTALKEGKEKNAVQSMAFAASNNMESHGWLKVGIAHVEVELLQMDQIQNQQLATLTAQLEKERAESQVRQNAILDRISKLQAIGYSPYEGAPVPDLSDECPF